MINRFIDEFRWLSNFVDAEVSFEGESYKSVEHAYVAAKTLNRAMRFEVAACPTAGVAKKMGKTMPLRPDWTQVRLEIMENLLRQKFSHPEFAEKLLNTGEQEIVEGNVWHDNFFGSCVCETCGNKGENNLGKLLMKIRGELIQIPLDFY